MKSEQRQVVRELTWFFAGTFLFSWGWWGLLALLGSPPALGLVVVGAWMPTLVAGLLTARLAGRPGLRRWLGQLRRWRLGWRIWALALLGPLTISGLALAFNALLGGVNPDPALVAQRFGLAGGQWPLLIPLFPVILLVTLVSGGPLAEELGWRGFAQPRLQQLLSPPAAGLVVGAFWALWHLPLFALLPAATGEIPLAWYIPLVLAWGVVAGVLYARSGGSVLLAMGLHAGINAVLGGLGLLISPPSSLLFGLFTLLNLLWAAALAYQDSVRRRLRSA